MPNGSNYTPDTPDLPGSPDDVLDDLEPEMVEGPLGIPVVKPKGAPNPPGTE